MFPVEKCTGFYWVLLFFFWVFWVFIGFTGCLLGFSVFFWVLIGFTGFYWVLLGFTGFYWVLLGFNWFYWVLLFFFTEFYPFRPAASPWILFCLFHPIVAPFLFLFFFFCCCCFCSGRLLIRSLTGVRSVFFYFSVISRADCVAAAAAAAALQRLRQPSPNRLGSGRRHSSPSDQTVSAVSALKSFIRI